MNIFFQLNWSQYNISRKIAVRILVTPKRESWMINNPHYSLTTESDNLFSGCTIWARITNFTRSRSLYLNIFRNFKKLCKTSQTPRQAINFAEFQVNRTAERLARNNKPIQKFIEQSRISDRSIT